MIPFFVGSSCSRAPSDRCVLVLAVVVPAELSDRRGPVNSSLYDPERVSGETNSWSSWTHAEGGKKREKEGGRKKERDSPFQPPLWPPALPSSTLQAPAPWPPRMQIPGLRPKFRNSKSIQIAGGTTAHRFTHRHAPPPHSPFSYPIVLTLVRHHTWFHLNSIPAKAPSSPTLSSLLHDTPHCLNTRPTSSLFFLSPWSYWNSRCPVYSDMRDIYSQSNWS